MRRLLPDDSPRTLAIATGLGLAAIFLAVYLIAVATTPDLRGEHPCVFSAEALRHQ